jgi:hypothetical protein
MKAYDVAFDAVRRMSWVFVARDNFTPHLSQLEASIVTFVDRKHIPQLELHNQFRMLTFTLGGKWNLISALLSLARCYSRMTTTGFDNPGTAKLQEFTSQ